MKISQNYGELKFDDTQVDKRTKSKYTIRLNTMLSGCISTKLIKIG